MCSCDDQLQLWYYLHTGSVAELNFRVRLFNEHNHIKMYVTYVETYTTVTHSHG